MEKTLTISGMMCNHCEMHVKKELEKIDGVTSAAANHESGRATVVLSKEVPQDAFKAAVEEAGYELTKVE